MQAVNRPTPTRHVVFAAVIFWPTLRTGVEMTGHPPLLKP
jgi:hypothetical protein